FSASYALVRGKTDSGQYLPFIPADKLHGELRFNLLQSSKTWMQTFFKVDADYVFDQDHPGQFETSTPAYWLLNTAVGSSIHLKNQELDITIGCNNLLDELYYDHLSRFKYFNIYN